MNIRNLTKGATWGRNKAILWKTFLQRIRPKHDSKPVFVLGKQRSGTTMLMLVFHRHPQVLVFDEHDNNRAFLHCRLRGNDVVQSIIESSTFPVVCFKPICDSHNINELHNSFPEGQFIWIFRDYRDNANSSLRKFESGTKAIRLVCTNQSGGGWFQEGISKKTGDTLRRVYRPDLSEFDLACLVWWARNQIILESGLLGKPNITLLKYEALVTAPSSVLEWLCDRISIGYREQIGRIVSARSIGRHEAPPLDPKVQQMCDSTISALDQAFQNCSPPSVKSKVNTRTKI